MEEAGPGKHEWALDLVSEEEGKTTFSVDADKWMPLSPSPEYLIHVNADSVKTTQVQDWATDIKMFSAPTGTVYYLTHETDYLILAVVVGTADASVMGENAVNALDKIELEVGQQLQLARKAETRATLFSVLDALLRSDVTSEEQRSQLTHAVHGFLQSDVSLSQLYGQLVHIMGYSTMRAIIRALEGKPNDDFQPPEIPNRVALSNIVETRKTQRPMFPIPIYSFATEEDRFAFFDSIKISLAVRANSLIHTHPWFVDLPTSQSRPQSRVGHTTVTSGAVLLITGGVLEEQPTGNGWDTLSAVNINNLKSIEYTLSGLPPSMPFGGSAVLVGSAKFCKVTTDAIVVFGGCPSLSVVTDGISTEGATIQASDLSDDLRVLDIQRLKWIKPAIPDNSPRPQARCFSLAIPVTQDIGRGTVEVSGFCILGGLGRPDRPCALDDCWLASLDTGQFKNIATTGFEGIWGTHAVPFSPNEWILIGGFGCEEALRVFSLVQERGRWRASVTKPHGGEDPLCGRRAFASAALMRAKGGLFEEIELGGTLYTTTPFEKNFLYIVGGYAENDLELDRVSVFEVLYNGVEITEFRFMGAHYPQVRPGSQYTANPSPRLCASWRFMPSITAAPHGMRPCPSVPAFLLSGGFTVKSTKNVNPIPRDFSSLAIVTLHSIDPWQPEWKLKSDSEAESKIEELQNSKICDVSDSQPPTLLEKRGFAKAILQTFDEHLRHNPVWLTKSNYAPSLLIAIGSNIPWPFTCIGNLLENSAHLTTRSTCISVDIALSKSNGKLFLAFTDNGKGMTYATVHRAMKKFGENCDVVEKDSQTHPTLRYGMGFKNAIGRLGQGTLLVSRTNTCLGVALHSQKFLKDSGATTMTAPACFWKLPSRQTIYTENEHLTHQYQLLQYSPFKTVTGLAEQINILGLGSGTRVCFFECAGTFPLEICLDVVDGSARLSSAPNRNVYESKTQIPQYNGHSDLLSLGHSWTLNDTANIKDGDPVVLPNIRESKSVFRELPVGKESFIFTSPDVQWTAFKEQEGFSSLLVDAPFVNHASTSENVFPFWTCGRDSIDLSLTTYLFWALLFCPATIYYGGSRLLPAAALPPCQDDPFRNSLYRLLKNRLHGLVELDWLFQPEDSNHETFGLLGFLNPLETLTGDQPLEFQEAGILLYYKERLIKRMFIPFPAPAHLLDEYGKKAYPKSHFEGKPIMAFPCTAVIHVPDWMLPNSNRDDFVCARSPIWIEFTNHMKRLLTEYLSVALSNERRQEWIEQRGLEFLQSAGRKRPLSPLLHLALFKNQL